MKNEPILGIDNFPTPIGGIQVTCIDWCVEPSDVDMEFDDEDVEYNEKVEKAIEEIEAGLPKEKFFEFVTNNIQAITDKINGLADELSDEYGFLVNSFKYDYVGVDGKPYEKWPRN